MRRTYFGIPLPVLVAVGLIGGYLWYRRGKNQQAASQAAAAQAQTTAPAQTGTDPVLVAYQAGEASGVSSYSAGVSQGIGLVESILGQFPTVNSQPSQTGTLAPVPAAGSSTSPAGSPSAAGGSGPVSATSLGETFGGAGYGYGNPYAPGGNQPIYGLGGPGSGVFEADVSAAQLQGQASNLWYSPLPGVFEPATSAVAPAGTQLYSKVA